MSERFGSGPLGERYDAALLFASEAHRRQTRKNGDVPYLSHLLRVSGLVLDYGGSETVAIAALLHDVVEDCGGLEALERIRGEFGAEVAEIVLETSDSTTADSGNKAPWRERKEAYIARLSSCSEGALLTSACDKLDNVTSLLRSLRTSGNMDILAKFKAGRDAQFWYYESILAVLEHRNSLVADELRIAVERLKAAWPKR